MKRFLVVGALFFGLVLGFFASVSAGVEFGTPNALAPSGILEKNGFLLEGGPPQDAQGGIAPGVLVTVNPITGEVAGVAVGPQFSKLAIVVVVALLAGAFVYFVSGKSAGRGKVIDGRKRLVTALAVMLVVGGGGVWFLAPQYKSGSLITFGNRAVGVDNSNMEDVSQTSEIDKAEAKEEEETRDWKTYESYDWGYRISFPPNWLLNNLRTEGEFDLFFEPDKKVMVAVRAQSAPELKDAAAREAVLEQIISDRKADPDYQVTQSGRTKVAQYEGAIVSSSTVRDGVSIQRNEILVTLAAGKLYHLVIDIVKDTPDELVADAEKVMNSFRIISEANIAPKLATFSGSFVYSGTCEVDLKAYLGGVTKPLEDSSKCGFGMEVGPDVTLVQLQKWYSQNSAAAGWLVVPISASRLSGRDGGNLDFFTMVRCAAEGDLDQEAIVSLEGGQMTVDLAGVKTAQSACIVDKQVVRLGQIVAGLLERGYKKAFDLVGKTKLEGMEIPYPSGWQDRSFSSEDSEQFSWAVGGNATSGKVIENEDKSQRLDAFFVDDLDAAGDFSVAGIKQQLNATDDIENMEAGSGAFSDIRGVWFEYELGGRHYFGTGAIYGSRPIYLIASTPEDAWANSRFLLLEMARSLR